MILERIETAARLFPSRTAFDDGKPLSYGELWQSALRRADAIRSLTASFAAPTALCAGKRETLISMLACLLTGVPYIPLSPDTPAARTLLSARKAGARLLVTDGPARFSEREGAEPFPASDPECLSLPDGLSVLTPEALDEHARGDFRPVGIDGSRTAYIIFTSGSTGEPKGVPIARASLENFVGWLDGLEGLSSADGADFRVMNQARFGFDLSVADLYYSLCGGHTLAAFDSDRDGPDAPWKTLASCRGAVMTPTFLRWLALDKRFSPAFCHELRWIFLCGERLKPSVAKKALDAFPDLILLNAYGPTEATCAVCAVRVTKEMTEREAVLPVGRVNGAACTVEVRDGEIVLIGGGVFGGYLADERGGHFVENGQNAYRTGDAGFIRDGLLYCAGRLDEQVKLKGFRIEPGEIEARLTALEGVADCAVIPKRAADGEVVAMRAFVTAARGFSLDGDDLKKRLAENLPAYMIPKVVRVLEAMPVTGNGKTDRKALELL